MTDVDGGLYALIGAQVAPTGTLAQVAPTGTLAQVAPTGTLAQVALNLSVGVAGPSCQETMAHRAEDRGHGPRHLDDWPRPYYAHGR